jgi:hypothetical protein
MLGTTNTDERLKASRDTSPHHEDDYLLHANEVVRVHDFAL